MTEKERVTIDFDEESYYLDGEYWESWDNYGEEMADEINKLLNMQEEMIQELYDFRLIYNALLFNEWSKHNIIEVYKSKKHSNGELCGDVE